MPRRWNLPQSFSISFEETTPALFRLSTRQELPLPREEAFSFFEDPRNLFEITPDWLDFRMVDPETNAGVFEGAEFDYTIRWLGVKLRWRGRIADYRPPDRFTDIQIRGPYLFWSHLHTFEPSGSGTLMRDEVRYRLPFGILGRVCHRMLVRAQLEDIFCYRAVRIAEWAGGTFRRKSG